MEDRENDADREQQEARATVTPPDPRTQSPEEKDAEKSARERANEATKEELEG